jgi:circadian clock protein KaiC
MAPESTPPTQLPTGIPGLDTVLSGGLPARRMYLLQGDPGAGKTTLALQFLLEGIRTGGRALYISLSETREELDAIAAAHVWSFEGLSILEVAAEEGADDVETTLYQPSEVELGERMRTILEEIDRLRPSRRTSSAGRCPSSRSIPRSSRPASSATSCARRWRTARASSSSTA